MSFGMALKQHRLLSVAVSKNLPGDLKGYARYIFTVFLFVYKREHFLNFKNFKLGFFHVKNTFCFC